MDLLPHILVYFRAEKEAAFWIIIVGGIALAASTWLWLAGIRRPRGGFHRGMAVPLASIAVIQLIAGGTIYLRTDAQIDRLTEQYYSDRAAFCTEETARMERVRAGLRFYQAIEIILMTAGLVLIIVYRCRPGWCAAGIGLVIQAGIMLVFDLAAAHRAEIYITSIKRLIP
jgi:hypothetical protein